MTVDDLGRQGTVLRLASDGRILEVFADGLGLGSVGASLADALDEQCADKAGRFLEEVRTKGHASEWELIAHVDGEPTVLTFSGDRSEDGSLVVIAARSVTDIEWLFDDLVRMNDEQAAILRGTVLELARARRRSDPRALDEMARLNNELASAQRTLALKNAELERANQQKRQLFGMVAHDLRNPLGIVVGYAEALLEDGAEPLSSGQRRILERIVASSEHMRTLVDGLVDLSIIDAGSLHLDRRSLDLAELIRDAVELNQIIAARKEIEVSFESSGPMPVVADAGKLRQVIDNLLSNAIKYSHSGTSVRVIGGADGEDAWEVIVADEGQGIPAEELSSIFRPFARTSVRTTAGEKSTGLGLAIARHIVRAHGGDIAVVSEVGVGTSFSMRLPRASEDASDVARD